MGNSTARMSAKTIPAHEDGQGHHAGEDNGPGAKKGASTPGGKRTFKDSYTVGKDLGSGAFSVVKLATHKASNRDTAVKIIQKKKLSEEDLAALMTEISILCELDHPHIIKCFETFDEGNEFYIVTELVAGGELFDRIVAKTHYTEKEARDLVKLFLETMAYMHEKGIVHRDLKPENLLLTSDGDDADIKVADFGFAKKVTDLLPNETACGTPGYVAPEILRGDPYGVEVDIWSMGVICYVLLAGYPPFYDEDQKKLFRKIKEGKYHFHAEYWGNTSPEAIDLIKRMLCVSQKDRWTAKQLLEHAWIKAGDEALQKDMTKSLETLKRYRAKMRLKKGIHAVIATNRFKSLFGNRSNEGSQADINVNGTATPVSAKDVQIKNAASDINANEIDDQALEVPAPAAPAAPTGKKKKKNHMDAEEMRRLAQEADTLEDDNTHEVAAVDRIA